MIQWIIHSDDSFKAADSFRNEASCCLCDQIIESLTELTFIRTIFVGIKHNIVWKTHTGMFFAFITWIMVHCYILTHFDITQWMHLGSQYSYTTEKVACIALKQQLRYYHRRWIYHTPNNGSNSDQLLKRIKRFTAIVHLKSICFVFHRINKIKTGLERHKSE